MNSIKTYVIRSLCVVMLILLVLGISILSYYVLFDGYKPQEKPQETVNVKSNTLSSQKTTKPLEIEDKSPTSFIISYSRNSGSLSFINLRNKKEISELSL